MAAAKAMATANAMPQPNSAEVHRSGAQAATLILRHSPTHRSIASSLRDRDQQLEVYTDSSVDHRR